MLVRNSSHLIPLLRGNWSIDALQSDMILLKDVLVQTLFNTSTTTGYQILYGI